MTDQPARIEHHTIYPIPVSERHGPARDLFTIWFGSNIMRVSQNDRAVLK
jgi:NCS1 family nucleobase:cation symporter-1